MHAAILYRLTGEPDTDALSSHLGDGLPAADVDATAYLDGRTIHYGTLAGRITDDRRVPVVGGEGIHTETDEVQRKIQTEMYADLEGEWAGIDRGAGEALLESYLANEAGVLPESAEISLEAFAEGLPDEAETNGIVYAQSIEDGHRRDAAGARWHEDASTGRIPAEGVSALAVTYTWDGVLVDAMLAASGYVAVYRDWATDTFARWVADEIDPLLSYETDDQQTLGTESCDDCGRESENLEQHGDDRLCPVCLDKRQEETEEGVA